MQRKYIFSYVTSCNMCGCNKYKILGKRLNQSQGRNPAKKIGITTTIVKCINCDLIYPNPFPIPEKLSDHYGIPAESYWNESYFAKDPNYFKTQIEILKSLTNCKGGDLALDVGAGIGKAMIALDNAGFDTYGFEPSESFYKKAIEKMKIDPKKLQLASIEDSFYPQDHFDFITFGAVLEHLYDPSSSIQKAMGWLKPNGILHIEVPSSDWLIGKLVNFFYRVRGLDYVTNVSPMHEPFHLYEFSLKSFVENGKKSNYTIALHQYHVAETYLPKIFNTFLVPYMRMNNSGMQLSVWLRKN